MSQARRLERPSIRPRAKNIWYATVCELGNTGDGHRQFDRRGDEPSMWPAVTSVDRMSIVYVVSASVVGYKIGWPLDQRTWSNDDAAPNSTRDKVLRNRNTLTITKLIFPRFFCCCCLQSHIEGVWWQKHPLMNKTNKQNTFIASPTKANNSINDCCFSLAKFVSSHHMFFFFSSLSNLSLQ